MGTRLGVVHCQRVDEKVKRKIHGLFIICDVARLNVVW